MDSGTTLEAAMANHVRSVFAGVYLHEGFAAARQFFRQHVLSRRLDVDKLFDFSQPRRELSRLCARAARGQDPVRDREAVETPRARRRRVFRLRDDGSGVMEARWMRPGFAPR